MRIEASCHCGRVRFRCDADAPLPYQYCYCSICRKTAGGSGSAINIGARADTLDVDGIEHVGVYHARLGDDGNRPSPAARHFCRECGSALWLSDPRWPQLVHPHASAVDTPLPTAPARVHMMLGSKAAWVPVPDAPGDCHYPAYPPQSLADWHRQHGGGPQRE